MPKRSLNNATSESFPFWHSLLMFLPYSNQKRPGGRLNCRRGTQIFHVHGITIGASLIFWRPCLNWQL
ncbi:hypothetical protein HN51_014055 [Arachis hypogaea]